MWWWSQRAHWDPADWTFTGAVFVDGKPVGVQDIAAERFATRRAVTTGSWLGRSHQGQGLGKEMREAAFHPAFEGLGALEAHTSAFPDNEPSLGVTRSLGYAENGHDAIIRRANVPVISLRVNISPRQNNGLSAGSRLPSVSIRHVGNSVGCRPSCLVGGRLPCLLTGCSDSSP